jgi:arginine decarboxylase
MEQYSQERTPLHEALEKHRLERMAHFDVPGHKGGRGNKELNIF